MTILQPDNSAQDLQKSTTDADVPTLLRRHLLEPPGGSWRFLEPYDGLRSSYYGFWIWNLLEPVVFMSLLVVSGISWWLLEPP